jgi:hypothetical protein
LVVLDRAAVVDDSSGSGVGAVIEIKLDVGGDIRRMARIAVALVTEEKFIDEPAVPASVI